MSIIILTDSINPWHSVWVRVGHFTKYWPFRVHITTKIMINHTGLLVLTDKSRIESENVSGIILYRWTPNKDTSEIIENNIKKGMNIIADIDDNLWDAKGSWDHERLKKFTRILKLCNAITCSTSCLADMMFAMFPRKRIYLVENCAPKFQERGKNNTNKIRVGWTGAPWTREKDVLILKELVNWLIKNEKYQLVHIGHINGKRGIAEILGIPENKVEKKQLTSYNNYIQELDFDIGLAPLSTSNFEAFKSDVKLIEYSSQGIPWICSETNPYLDLAKQWKWMHRVCIKSNSWIDNCLELTDANLRKKEGIELLEKSKARECKKIAQKWHMIIRQELMGRH